MTSKWITGAGLVVVVVALLALLGRKSVRAELTIEAAPEEVWTLLTDPTSYPDWNPIFVSVEGEFQEGATLTVGMKNLDGTVTNVDSHVKKLVPGSEINQVGGIPGVLTFDHTWLLEPTVDGTRVTQYEVYRGIGVVFWDPSWVEATYERANAQLSDWLDAR